MLGVMAPLYPPQFIQQKRNKRVSGDCSVVKALKFKAIITKAKFCNLIGLYSKRNKLFKLKRTNGQVLLTNSGIT